MVWTDERVLPLAASGVYPKTRVWGSKPENVRCSRATPPLRIELRWGCEEYSEKTAVGSGVSFKYDPFGRRIYKSSSAGTSVYAYDDKNLIEEVNSAGSVVARYSQGLWRCCGAALRATTRPTDGCCKPPWRFFIVARATRLPLPKASRNRLLQEQFVSLTNQERGHRKPPSTTKLHLSHSQNLIQVHCPIQSQGSSRWQLRS
jgi:hypothetical protein